jgi:membrane-associated phospholipid phosphatase
MVPLTIGLAISTMYHGYHYGVDVLYGFFVGAVALWVMPRVFGRHEWPDAPAADRLPES